MDRALELELMTGQHSGAEAPALEGNFFNPLCADFMQRGIHYQKGPLP